MDCGTTKTPSWRHREINRVIIGMKHIVNRVCSALRAGFICGGNIKECDQNTVRSPLWSNKNNTSFSQEGGTDLLSKPKVLVDV